MNNPMDMLKAIKNPKKYVMDMMQNNNNPILKNLVNMANTGNQKGVEEFARNLYREQGRDFDKEIQELQELFK